jgi:hypothetical protein
MLGQFDVPLVILRLVVEYLPERDVLQLLGSASQQLARVVRYDNMFRRMWRKYVLLMTHDRGVCANASTCERHTCRHTWLAHRILDAVIDNPSLSAEELSKKTFEMGRQRFGRFTVVHRRKLEKLQNQVKRLERRKRYAVIIDALEKKRKEIRDEERQRKKAKRC